MSARSERILCFGPRLLFVNSIFSELSVLDIICSVIWKRIRDVHKYLRRNQYSPRLPQSLSSFPIETCPSQKVSLWTDLSALKYSSMIGLVFTAYCVGYLIADCCISKHADPSQSKELGFGDLLRMLCVLDSLDHYVKNCDCHNVP